jgi:hypothetical protein
MIPYVHLPFASIWHHAETRNAAWRLSFLSLAYVPDSDRLVHNGRDGSYLADVPGLAHHFAAF